MSVSWAGLFTITRNFWKSLKSIKDEQKKEWLLDCILEEGLEYETGTGHLYSDVGYILLGYVVEKKSGVGLDHYWRDNVAEPAGVAETLFFPTQKEQNNFGNGITFRTASRGFGRLWCTWLKKGYWA